MNFSASHTLAVWAHKNRSETGKGQLTIDQYSELVAIVKMAEKNERALSNIRSTLELVKV